MRKTNYCDVVLREPIPRKSRKTLITGDGVGSLLGDKIVSAFKYGSSVGPSVVPTFDEEGAEGVDLLSSPNHDFFDIAEHVGHAVDVQQSAGIANQVTE